MAQTKTVRTIKPIPEMADDLRTEKKNTLNEPMSRNVYNKANDETDLRLSVAIKTRADSIRNGTRTKVNFNDVEDVKQRTVDFLDACSLASVYPTILGLAVHGFGVSRQALYQHMNSFPDSEETLFLRMVSDMFADILVNDSLRRRCDCASAIFMLKNLHGFKDNAELPIPDVVVDNAEHDNNYYKEKYGYLSEQE